LLVSAGAINGLVDETDILLFYFSEADIFKYLLQQIYPPYVGLSLDKRLDVARSIPIYGCDSAKLLRMAFTPGGFAKETFTHTDMSGSTFLHYVTAKFAKHCSRYITSFDKSSHNGLTYRDINNPDNSWRRLIKEMVMAGAMLHAVNLDRRSILCNIINHAQWSYSGCSKDVFTTILQVIKIWLFDLQEAGIDLVCYGADEKVLHLGRIVDNRCTFYLRNCRGPFFMDLIAFTYGPCPEDWQFYFSDPTDVFAGEFWALVEAAACKDELDLPVPGSWIE
jgi:hypothetical protein